MSNNDDEFTQKLEARINQVGPCCSCLVIAIIVALAFLWLVGR